MMALGLEESGVLDQIVMAKGAWVPLVGLAPPAAVSSLLDRGLVALWCKDASGQTLKDGPFVTLTPIGATVRHVTLFERVEGYPRWIDVKRAARRERNHSPLREGRWVGVRLMPFPELIAIEDRRETYMSDGDGRRVYLFNGVPIRIDPRLTRWKRHATHR